MATYISRRFLSINEGDAPFNLSVGWIDRNLILFFYTYIFGLRIYFAIFTNKLPSGKVEYDG